MPPIFTKPVQPRLGINLDDLFRIPQAVQAGLLGGKVSLERDKVLRLKGELTETFVPFTCPMLEAAIACDLIRDIDRKAGDDVTRVYVKKEVWSKLPSHAVLTEVVHGKVVLYDKWFRDAELPTVASIPLKAKRVF